MTSSPPSSNDDQQPDLFEPTGREPELSGYDQSDTPMLGGDRRQWPSIAAYLLSEQHQAQRSGQMERVWIIRRLRARIQKVALQNYYTTGERTVTHREALQTLIDEREQIEEELAQARQYLRPLRAAEHNRALAIVEAIIAYWEDNLKSQE